MEASRQRGVDDPYPRPPLRTLGLLFVRLGTTAFGGPVAYSDDGGRGRESWAWLKHDE